MKYRLLINGNNPAIIREFLSYTDNTYFDCISTSGNFKDMVGHFKFYKPDVFLVFLDSVFDDITEKLENIKKKDEYNGTPIVIVAKKETCADLASEPFQNLAHLVLMRPISPDNIMLRLMNFLEEKEKIAAEAAAAKKKEKEGRKQILIVDDDRNILKLLKSALEDKYDVTAMVNGLLVEKILASKPIDLIILDYEMPVMTGADVFRTIRSKPETEKLPVCFLTGVSERSKVQEIMSLRPDGYLLKPIDMDMLKATIENLTDFQ